MTPPISHDDAMRTCTRILSDYEAMQAGRESIASKYPTHAVALAVIVAQVKCAPRQPQRVALLYSPPVIVGPQKADQ